MVEADPELLRTEVGTAQEVLLALARPVRREYPSWPLFREVELNTFSTARDGNPVNVVLA